MGSFNYLVLFVRIPLLEAKTESWRIGFRVSKVAEEIIGGMAWSWPGTGLMLR